MARTAVGGVRRCPLWVVVAIEVGQLAQAIGSGLEYSGGFSLDHDRSDVPRMRSRQRTEGSRLERVEVEVIGRVMLRLSGQCARIAVLEAFNIGRKQKHDVALRFGDCYCFRDFHRLVSCSSAAWFQMARSIDHPHDSVVKTGAI